MWRQGDVLIEQVNQMPPALPRLKRLILAAGDSSGQRHQIKDRKGVQLFGDPDGDLFLVVASEETSVVHPEHDPIKLPTGTYRVWKQREFIDAKARRVID